MSLSADPPIEAAPRHRSLWGYPGALALVAAATWGAVLVDRTVGATNLSLIFVLPVVICAVGFGWGPALLAAAAGVAAFNFFLLEPRYSFAVADAANVWALVVLGVVAAIVCTVAAEARGRAMEAAQRADQALALQVLARALAGATDRETITRAAADALARLFRASAVVLVAEDDELEPAALAGGARLTPADEDAARWAVASKMATRAQAYPVEAATFDFWPVVTRTRRRAAVGVQISGRDAGRPAQPERLVEVVTGYLAVALARDDYAAQALETQVEVARERLKAELLAAVSHDLKTPLSTVLFSLQSLQTFGEAHDAAARAELLGLAERETARLSGMVGNLLDMSRLDAGAVVVRKAATSAAALAQVAVTRAAAALAGKTVRNEVDGRAGAVLTDASLTESALANLLENAGKYAPAGSTVRLAFREEGGLGVFEVLDEGPGFDGAIEPMFEKFTRGVEGDGRPPGTGLGLAIARGFVEAQGGRVEAANRTDGPGARVRLSLPLAKASVLA